MIITFWDTEDGAQDASGFASAGARAPRDDVQGPARTGGHEVAFADMEGVLAA